MKAAGAEARWAAGQFPFPTMTPGVRRLAFGDLEPVVGDRPVPVTDDDVALLVHHGLAGTARRVARTVAVELPETAFALLDVAALHAVHATMVMVRRSQPALETLTGAGVPWVVTKGPGVAGFEPAGERPFGDLDVVVAPRDFATARRLLGSLGFEERTESRQPWSLFDRHCREAVNLRSPAGGSVDLHHHVPPWRWTRRLTADLLLAHPQTVTVAGVALPVASPEVNLLVCALHTVSDRNAPGSGLRVWRDVLVLAHRVDAADAVALARRVGLDGWLRWVLGRYPERLQPRHLLDRLDGAGSRRAGPRGLDRWTTVRPLLSPTVAHALRLPTANALLYGGGLLTPSRAFLDDRFPGHVRPYRAWWRHLRATWRHPEGGRWRGGVAMPSLRPGTEAKQETS